MPDGAEPAAELDRLIAELRPGLHRYCARMVGSAFEGEDVVQDALAKAAEAWPAAGVLERPQSWLFRIAHNTALDALRHRRSQAALRARAAEVADHPAGADARVAAASSFATLMALSPAQRSCVVLIDVLGHSLEEACAVLAVTPPAAKAALHRGRLRLRELAAAEAPPPALDLQMRQQLQAYADRFNARDFDALRALLAEDVRLDLVNRTRLAGRKDVGIYFTRYAEAAFGWRMAAGQADGRPAILVSDPADPAAAVRFVVLLDWKDGQIAAIRDFFYADYVMEGVTVTTI
jgi:RNA polymerase sigma-70 factor (ECF subfamily)